MTTSTRPRAWVNATPPLPPTRIASPVGGTGPLLTVDAHRQIGGAFTAAGALLRKVVPDALRHCPDLLGRHQIEVLAAAPDLATIVPSSRETLASLAIPEEHTRFYPRVRVLRISQGLVDFLDAYLRRSVGGRLTLVVDHVEHAAPSDLQFLAVLARRIDPDRLRLVLHVRDADLPTALIDVGTLHAWPRLQACRDRTTPGGRADVELAAAYVAGDGAISDPAALAGYLRHPAPARARLHDERAAALEASGDPVRRHGAVPFHRERGSDPSGAGIAALDRELQYCLNMGFYEEAVDVGTRMRALIDWRAQPVPARRMMGALGMALNVLGRTDEAQALYDETLDFADDPLTRIMAGYGTAMSLTRYRDDDRKDHRQARDVLADVVELCRDWPDHDHGVFLTAFNWNGLALVEAHLGRPEVALDLVNRAIALLDRELDADRHRLHRSVLRYNRGQIYAGLGRVTDALTEYEAVIAADPNYSEYHLDRGNLLRRLGRDTEARTEYDTAIGCSPPYPEAFYNRADTRVSLGDSLGALADYSRVIELDPTLADAWLNRAALLVEQGDVDAASRDVEAGLALDQDNARLWCLRGSIAVDRGRPERALDDFGAAIARDPDLVEAWAGRAGAWFALDRADRAVADLSRAIGTADDPALRFNRGVAYESLGSWTEAVDDFTAALDCSPAEASDVLVHRGQALVAAGRVDEGRDDLLRALADADSEQRRTALAGLAALRG